MDTAVQDRGPLIPQPKVAERYHVTTMTLWRWQQDEKLNFPKPIRIGPRLYFYLADLIVWEKERAAKSANSDAGAQARLMAEKRARRA
jgi:predicted DNA-binding transcriptional regulator AlpA